MTCFVSVVGVYFGCFSCVQFVHGISNWTLGTGECYTFGFGFRDDPHRQLIRKAMYSKGGGRGRPNCGESYSILCNPKNNRKHRQGLDKNGKPKLGYIFRHEDDDGIDFDNVYRLNSSCVNILGIVAVETFLCFGKPDFRLVKCHNYF